MAALTLRLFGPMQAVIDGQPLPKMRSRKALWILAILVLREGRAITRERLAAMLWPDSEREVGLSNLRPLISELRSALQVLGEPLTTPDRRAIMLDLSSIQADVLQFKADLVRGELELATQIYTGVLLEDCDDEWIIPEREAKELACLDALDRLIETCFARGDFAAATGFAQKGVLLAPKREAPRRTLMETLSRSGDISGALESYRDYERALRGQRGGAPDPQTASLYRQLREKARRTTRSAEERDDSPPVVSQLGAPLNAIVGRENERVDLWAKLDRHRLVTLTGFGGIGKTRLAREVANEIANRFDDGACVVSLEAITDGHLVIDQFALALRLRRDTARPLLTTLIEKLQTKKMLLVVDNCEHLLSECSMLLRQLLASCRGLTVLATSRQPLGIPGEVVWSVPALTYCNPDTLTSHLATRFRVVTGYEATQLFVQRAMAACGDFQPDQHNIVAVARVCAHVEGIPLAIELAAARVRSMTPEEIAARLVVHEFRVLGDSDLVVAPRQRTVRATLDWSYGLLSEREKTVLQRLSVFKGGWTLEAAEQVTSDDSIAANDIVDILDSLVSKSLILFTSGKGMSRYGVLDTVHNYAREKLVQTDDVNRRFAAWCRSFAERAELEERSADRSLWIERVEAEHQNILSLLNSGHASSATKLRLCNALSRYWMTTGHSKECERFVTESMERIGPEVSISERVKALRTLCVAAFQRQDYARCRNLHDDAMRLSGESTTFEEQATFKLKHSSISLYEGNYARAKQEVLEAIGLARLSADPKPLWRALGMFAAVTHCLGECNLAREALEEGVVLSRQDPTLRDTPSLLKMLAGVLCDQGQYEVAELLCKESLEMAHQTNNLYDVAEATFGLGQLFSTVGDLGRSRLLLQSALEQFRKLENAYSIGNALIGIGRLDLEEGRIGDAVAAIEESLSIFKSHGHEPGIGRSLTALVDVHRALNDPDAARQSLAKALSIQLSLQEKRAVAGSLLALSEYGVDREDPVLSLRCVAVAETLRTLHVWEWSPQRREEVISLQASLRKDTGAVAFDKCWDQSCNEDWQTVVGELLLSVEGWYSDRR